jgi:hypothetical protein
MAIGLDNIYRWLQVMTAVDSAFNSYNGQQSSMTCWFYTTVLVFHLFRPAEPIALSDLVQS